MATLLQGTESDVIVGPAAMFLAPSTYPMPQRIADVLSLSTYIGNATYGFLPVGYTQVGVTMTREVSTKQVRTDQRGLLKTYPIDYKSTVTTDASQPNQQNKVQLQQASIGAANTAGELVTYFEATPFLSLWRLAVIMQDDRGKFHARVYPKAQWDGKAQKEMFERAVADTVSFSFECLPSSDVVGPNGQPSDRIDFDSP